MTELLETIDESLQEVEEQLLQEFDRIRNSLSDSQLEPIDPGVKNALGGVVDEMRTLLDQSGDRQNLQLMTEQHEVLHSRIVVLRQLLNAKVPTAYLHEAHIEVKSSRKELESRVIERRQADDEHKTEEKAGLFGKLKGMFSGKQSEKETARNKIRVTEEEAKKLEPVTIYLDNGIYSASRELSALANIFKLPAQQQNEIKEQHAERISGKAQFASKDLSNQAPIGRPSKNIAQTPEAIRAKLSERENTGAASKASFGSKDIEHVKAKEVSRPQHQPPPPGPLTGKASFASRDIAHEQPREVAPTSPPTAKQEEAEPTPQAATGKATFASKDIEPIAPQEFRGPRKKDTESKEEKPRTGKAVFESKDLSNPKP